MWKRGVAMGLTFGVEEEFLLADAVSGQAVSRAGTILERVGEHPYGGAFQAELFQTQVEVATGVCDTLGRLRRQIEAGRAALAAAARREGLRVLSVGTPIVAGPAPVLTPGERFERIMLMHAGAVAEYQACGLHVHVGVADREQAVVVLNHLRPWLPVLLALSANSPLHHGRDTGFASWRSVEQSRFPSSGVPPRFSSPADYARRLGWLVESGLLVDKRMTFWLARHSERWPTVEIRAADAALTVDDAVLQAALTRALVRTALADAAAGKEPPEAEIAACATAVWNAARHGLDGPGVDASRLRVVPGAHLLRRLVEYVTPALDDLGDLPEVVRLLARVARHGTGAVRQRRAARHGMPAVVDLLSVSNARGKT
ncbi:glutamate--cysteine ligase [Nonomuraea sp. NPDC050536]|uniref:glutamate--cysteine ligase n=1 Tax=Nonomuraea sp. NPDC050536 TaxID=3364366 RepID=UPI0037C6981A